MSIHVVRSEVGKADGCTDSVFHPAGAASQHPSEVARLGVAWNQSITEHIAKRMHMVGYSIDRRQRLSNSLQLFYREFDSCLRESFHQFIIQCLHISTDVYVQDPCKF